MTQLETTQRLINPNPHIPTSFYWYKHELNILYPNQEVRQSRGYKFHVGSMIIDCKDNDVNKWVRIK